MNINPKGHLQQEEMMKIDLPQARELKERAQKRR
jgi:hypothetical protein